MGETADPAGGRATALIDQLAGQQQVLARAQSELAALMLEFGDLRRKLDDDRIAGRIAERGDPRYAAGEFGTMEIGLAITASTFSVQRTVGIARRLRHDTPDAWDAWRAGDIDQGKAARINRALLRLTKDASKQLLNTLVVPVAICKTAELLGRWLNQFVARVEPDQTDERMRRSFADRYVSLRPDLDGMTFLSAALSSVDAVAIDQVLDALAGTAAAGDTRTLQQRRADVLVDLLLGRTSNGCHVNWDENDSDKDQPDDDHDHEQQHHGEDCHPADATGADATSGNEAGDDDRPWDPDDDWGLPATAFHRTPDGRSPRRGGEEPPHIDRPGRAVISTCPVGYGPRPPSVTIGVVVSVQSLFGYSDAPGQLMDRSALVPADTIRALAQQAGTLFYRLLTDDHGNLLDVTETGRFPSRKLGLAVKFRDGVCTHPTCTTPAGRCDLDHLIPVPEGPTSGGNLAPTCRPEHRAKTHAGHMSSRTAPHTSHWTTPTGHTYSTQDDPLPVENWPDQTITAPNPQPRRRTIRRRKLRDRNTRDPNTRARTVRGPKPPGLTNRWLKATPAAVEAAVEGERIYEPSTLVEELLPIPVYQGSDHRG